MHDDHTTRLTALEASLHTLTRRLRWQRNAALLLLALGLLGWPLAGTQAQDRAAQALTLEQRVAALEKKLKHVIAYVNGAGRPIVEITGANLRIVNGTGQTATVNGTGNLIVGYNELRGGSPNVRTGSHNLLVGRDHDYASYGGLVAGQWNAISGAYATVCGGFGNAASGDYATVAGGVSNTASGQGAVASGGHVNHASGQVAAVHGGTENLASGDYATVSGGGYNTARGYTAVVSGGTDHLASGGYATVSGGWNREAAGWYDWVGGGLREED